MRATRVDLYHYKFAFPQGPSLVARHTSHCGAERSNSYSVRRKFGAGLLVGDDGGVSERWSGATGALGEDRGPLSGCSLQRRFSRLSVPATAFQEWGRQGQQFPAMRKAKN